MAVTNSNRVVVGIDISSRGRLPEQICAVGIAVADSPESLCEARLWSVHTELDDDPSMIKEVWRDRKALESYLVDLARPRREVFQHVTQYIDTLQNIYGDRLLFACSSKTPCASLLNACLDHYGHGSIGPLIDIDQLTIGAALALCRSFTTSGDVARDCLDLGGQDVGTIAEAVATELDIDELQTSIVGEYHPTFDAARVALRLQELLHTYGIGIRGTMI